MGFALHFLDPSYSYLVSSPCLPISCLAEATTVAALSGMLSALAWPGLPSLSSSTQPAAPARSLQCPGPFKSIRLVARQQCGPRWNCTAEALPGPAWPGRSG